jgi:hypothetical protein
MKPMHDYLVFGNCLRSELPFPELAESRGRDPRWTLRIADLASDDGAEVLSDSSLSSSCHIRISRHNGRLQFFHSCAGSFELSADGSDIVFDAKHAVDVNAARTDFVSRLLLMSVEHDRVTWLHGSAVSLGDAGIAFIGPSGSGKSTLALALTQMGAQHICDDALPIEAGDPPQIWPSDRTIRLCGDAKTLFASNVRAVRRESDGKFVMTHDAIESMATRRAAEIGSESRPPLAALYLLKPFDPSESSENAGTRVSRRPIAPTAALPLLIQHLKLGAMMGPEYPARAMKQLGAIVASVPVFELRVAHDWSAIEVVVEQIADWHHEKMDSYMPGSAQLKVLA